MATTKPINMCDGCQAGIPIESSPSGLLVHVDRERSDGTVGGAFVSRQVCTADRYVTGAGRFATMNGR